MKKINLDPDTLKVDSFSTSEPAVERGTVVANAIASAYPCSVYDSVDYTACGCGGASGHMTCGNGSDCTPGYTNYETCETCRHTWCA